MTPQEDIPASRPLLEKSRALLGWPLVCESLAGFALSEVARARCLQWIPVEDPARAQDLLLETEAMGALLDSAEGFPIRGFSDLTPVLEEAGTRRMIEPEQGLAVLNLLTLVRDVRRRLKSESVPPALRGFGEALEPVPALISELDRCLDPQEGVRENASPELKAAVKEAAAARAHLESSVKKLMASAPVKDALQDSYFTEREGRLVLPVRSDAKARVEGIVHDSSGSGQTLFLEPSSIVPLNNQLKIARMNVEREKARVLARLAEAIVEVQPVLARNQDRLAELDVIHARARLARRMHARPCELTSGGGVDLKQARNPELVLAGRDVVPNSLAWDSNVRVLIISGPNTGGKTVTLKTLGLMALMIRAGLLLPVDGDSRLPFFPEVYADIGDEQDIGQDLSTFSGHLNKIVQMLHHAAPGALVLLDELGIATDPQQGAALAQAILMEMKQRGLTTLVSTHYFSLKTLAQTEPGFLNACTEFDMDRLTPTFRLMFGVPGQSAALETAKRLGLDPAVIQQARALYDRQDHRAEGLLQELTRQKQRLETDREAVAEQRRLTEQALREQNQITGRLREQERKLKKNQSQKLQTLVRDARREIRKLLDEARGARNASQLKQKDRALQALGRSVGSVPSDRRALYTVPADRLKAGDEVMVDGYEAVGVLLETPAGKNKVPVRLGNFTTVVETRRLLGHAQGHRTRPPADPGSRVNIQTETQSRPAATCDLRGMNLEEARNALELFLSQAVLNKMPRVTLIHGHGMGKIKRMVRDYLGDTGIGKQFGPAPREQGGDGATIVEF